MKFLFNRDPKKISENKVENITPQNFENHFKDKLAPESNGDLNNEDKRSNGILNKLKEHKKIIFFLLLIPISIVLVILFLYYVVLGSSNRTNLPLLNESFTLIESKTKAFDPSTFYYPVTLSPITVRDKQNPLNGTLLTSDQYKALSVYRPIAVSTDNEQNARPQSGVSSADIVYEFPVEGGISRYLAFYWSSFPSSMGPVRSFRTYFGDIVQEYDALLYHIGQAEIPPSDLTTKPELSVYDSSTYFSQNSIKRTSCGYTRDQERIKNQVAIEHTAYISVDALRSCVSEAYYKGLPNITALKYKPDLEYALRSNNSSASISFGTSGSVNKSEWVYDRTENVYKKVVNGADDIDRNNSQTIKVKNLIIELVPVTTDYSANGRLNLNLIGQGKAEFLEDGKVLEGIWQKDTKTSRTKYFKQDGSELEFNRGKIWVTVIGTDYKYQVQ